METASVLALTMLQWSFLAALVALTGAAGVFGLYVVLQLFRNPARPPARRRSP